MRIMVVAGARPNFMKVAPIMEQLTTRRLLNPEISALLVHTGQHYDAGMSDRFFADLGLPAPGINLGVGSGTHAEQTARVMIAFEKVCLERQPDWVVVVGDVNSTLACGLTAKKLGIRVAHVEAGLRSRDMNMPEEINRLCVDAISDLLFTTDALADANLLAEGVALERIRLVGNTMIDSLLRHLPRAKALPLPDGLVSGKFGVLTLHRPSNVDDRSSLTGILEAASDISRRLPIVFPAHPRTRRNLGQFGLSEKLEKAGRFVMAEPASYLTFLGLLSHARMVLTDSGGIQEETTVLGVPCLTLRFNTERPITCQSGTNLLVGNEPAKIREAAWAVLDGRTCRGSIPELWDGHAAERIISALVA